MHTQDFLINNSGNWKTVETVCESLPKFYVVSSLAFVIKTINSVNACAFMVTSEKEEVFRVFDFVSEEETNCFK